MIFFLSLREGFFQGKNTASDENKIFKKKKKEKKHLPFLKVHVKLLF